MKDDVAILRALWPLLATQRYALAIIIGLGLASSLLEGVGIYLFLPILELLSSEQTLPAGLSFLHLALNQIPANWRVSVLVLLVVISIGAKNALSYWNGAYIARVDADNSHRLRCELFTAMLLAAPAYLETQQSGRLANALLSESWRLSRALGAFYRMIVDACAILIFVAVLLTLSWRTTLYVAPFIGLIVCVMHLVTRRARAIGEGAVATNTAYTDRAWETLGGLRTIQIFGREAYEDERHAETSSGVRHYFLRARLLANAVPLLFETLVATAFGVWIVALSWLGTGFPTMAVFLLVLYRMQPRVQSIVAARAEILEFGSAALELDDVRSECVASRLPEGAHRFNSLEHSIVFRDVSAGYAGRNSPALSDIDFTLLKNTTTALVGPSGSGKSTLVNLLLRSMLPDKGDVLIDGVPMRHIRARDWHARIAAVTQDIFLFEGSIADNIRYGKLDASLDEIVEAARLAHADEFIANLPKGYDTEIGERGMRLSGGQRQRIALARALVRQPEILVIDEGTNALDSHSERLIQHALGELSRTTTIVAVAHRLSTVRNADQILLVDKGRIIERGTYNELIACGGMFTEMVQLQALDADERVRL
ncbi:ABC transporter ATP-binding protein [Devosia sp. 1566]|uniref:ABC transporter ATP-binding protein n=1 Tax=Devosia sp. 1566 TaxID=2499144 RepID=UPI000FDA40A6|nr:ABC transporter ATP-binding protein [Devosia sp. 1566]